MINYNDISISYFDLGAGRTASFEKTSSGYFKTVVKDDHGTFENMFSDPAKALAELLSYCEIESEDF